MVVLLGASGVLRAEPAPAQPVGGSVLVLSPSVLNPDRELSWLGPAMRQSLVADLLRHLSDPVASSQSCAADSSEALALARKSNASRVISGEIQLAGDGIRFTGMVLEVKTERVLATLKVTGRLNDLFEMEDELSEQASHALAVRKAGPSAAPITIASSGPLRASYAAPDSQAGMEYAAPYVSNRFQTEANRYIYLNSYWGCGYYWGYPGWGCYGGWYSIYPTASPGWAW
jgi:TolB-like protein